MKVYYICLQTSTNKIISVRACGHIDPDGTIIDNLKSAAIIDGWPSNDLSIISVSDELYQYYLNSNPVYVALAAAVNANNAQRTADFTANIPSLAAVQAAINSITTIADAKAFLLKLSKVVYWLATNSPT